MVMITVNGDVIINFEGLFDDESIDDNTPLTRKQVQKLRTNIESKNTKKRIHKRDVHCQCCGEQGKQLQVHHIMPLSEYPDLNCDDGNLICLCQACHDRYHREYKDDGINAYTFSLFMMRYAKRRF